MSNDDRKAIKCRAAIFYKVGEPLKIEEITVDPPKTGEIRVRMVSTSICATDLHVVTQGLTFGFDYKAPVILGHEGAGIVESVGEGVKGINVGDHVIPLCMPNCDKCELCKSPQTNFCEVNVFEIMDPHSGTKLNGRPLVKVFGLGTFAEYILLGESQVAVVNKNANLKDIALIGCALITGYGAALNEARVYEGSKCVVWGLGGVGLSTVIGCKALGAKTIIGIDILSERESISKELGCTEFINPNTFGKSVEEYLNSIGGVDFAFDCVGNVSILETAMRCLTRWGTLVIVGVPTGDVSFSVSIVKLITGQQIAGGFQGRLKSRKTIQSFVDKQVNGEIDIKDLITQRIKLQDINEAFNLFEKGKVIRCVIEF